MTEQTELKPCPFCGGDSGCFGEQHIGFWVECGSCCADLGKTGSDYYDTGYYDSRQEAITAWNRRA